jgi:thiol:disulfide interchange protein DsbA
MRRREFSGALAGAVALVAPLASKGQDIPVEGRHYVQLSQPVAVSAPAGKLELIDFFWYGCPHCAAFEPALDAWSRHLPEFTTFSRVPVAFRPEPFATHQRIFYALEALGQLEAQHRRVFYAIHNEKLAMNKPAEIAAYLAPHGVDSAKFLEAFSSFTTQSKIKRANALVDAYQIDGVPAIGVHGRYYTSGAMAGSNEQALIVADYLVQKLHKSN